jgi:hypothetical protein
MTPVCSPDAISLDRVRGVLLSRRTFAVLARQADDRAADQRCCCWWGVRFAASWAAIPRARAAAEGGAQRSATAPILLPFEEFPRKSPDFMNARDKAIE